MIKCDRCKRETEIHSMSYMNKDILCLDCLREEKQHPRFEEAKERELEEIVRGNFNYEGLFAGQKYPFKD